MKDQWKKLVSGVAPMLGTALGGPMGGIAAKAITGALLGEDNATDDLKVVEQAVKNATPDQLLALKKADNDFDVQMKELDFKLEDVRLKDVQDARDMAKSNMWPQIILSIVMIVGYFWIVYLEASDPALDIDDYLLGVLTGAIPMILQFWFGSSTGSKEKTHKLKK